MDVSYITLYTEQNLTALAHTFQSYNDMCISYIRKTKKTKQKTKTVHSL